MLVYGHLQSRLPRHYAYGFLSKNSKSEIFGFHCLCPLFDKLLYTKFICKNTVTKDLKFRLQITYYIFG